MVNARSTAVKLLTGIDNNNSYSNILLDSTLNRSRLSAQDKKFASALFYGVLERRYTLDAIIAAHLKRPSDKLNGEIRNILRIGIYQLLYMDSVPDSAAVDECVTLAKGNRNPAASGFVNGMLRTFIREGKGLPETKNDTEKLCMEYSCPPALVKKWLNEYGREITVTMLETSLGKAPVTVKANTLKCSLDEIIESLENDGCSVARLTRPTFITDCVGVSLAGSVENTDAYKSGLIHVQDLSSRICCEALDARKGDTVLDICAAPGGKTFTIAELMQNDGRIYAFDLHENRVRLISTGAQRLGLDCVTAMTNDGKVFREDMPKADRVLCDVPCSGLGVIRRKPEIKYKNLSDFERLPQVQYDILDTSSAYVKEGGRLVYSTCTLSRAENDEVCERFLKNHKEFSPAPLPSELLRDENDSYKITITPDRFNSDGFFIAAFQKIR